jgi:uncharacterized phage protein (TIGR01671 family)
MKNIPKFRAWDKQYKQMVKVTMLLLDTEEIDYEDNLNEPKNIEHFELMQFTGVSDRKGNPIYDGDIMKVGERLTCKVYYINKNCNDYGDEIHAAFHAEIKSHNKIIPFDSYLTDSCIVVGNIYENPELLNEQ